MASARIQTGVPPVLAGRAANDESLRDRENDHRMALLHEHAALEHRYLSRLARGAGGADVWLPAGGRPERRHVLEVLAEHPRLLITGARWTGKSVLAAFLLAQAARHDIGLGDLLPIAAPGRRLPDAHLDEEVLARLSPAAGIDVVRAALESGRALVVVDGVDEAPSPERLKRALAGLAARHPRSRFVATTRPLPARVAGRSETLVDGFVAVPLAGPRKEPGATVHELRPARPASGRVLDLAAEVDELLERWGPGRLPPGAALRGLTERGRFLLVCHLASNGYDARQVEIPAHLLCRFVAGELAEARWFADTGQLLHPDEAPRAGEPVADPDALAARIVDDVARHPGVLVEQRPGVFAFASLAVQRYLTAAFFAKQDLLREMLTTLHDPWWHPVIVMAAGLPAPLSSVCPAREVIGELLRQWVTADSVATFLADQAAEVARDLPAPLRREVERRVRAALPLRSDAQLAHLVDGVGEVAVPALLRALDTASPDERARTLTALGRLDHPDAIRALARYVADGERTTEPMLCWAWHVDALAAGVPVGFFAFAAFFNLALSHPAADALYDQVLARTSEETRAVFVELVVRKLLDDVRWGADAPEERDPWRSQSLLEKILARGVPSG